MSNQYTFSDMEYSNRRKVTAREKFLTQMDEIIPWEDWVAIIQPYYPNNNRGRRPIGIETMLRMYLMQVWFSLSDIGVEDAIYDSYAMRNFMHINFLEEQVPDSTTLLHFRHLLEEHDIGKAIFEDIKQKLEDAGLMMHGGTIVDASIIKAPSSTKNQKKERDPEMHQTKKGNQWYHGMKVHIGVDAGSGHIHSVTATPANAHDVTESANLIRQDDDVVYGDSGYLGIMNQAAIQENPHFSGIDYRINTRPSSLKISKDYKGINWDKEIEHRKSSTRCKVEHAFLIVKQQMGYSKVAYRGIAKNLNRFFVLFGSANLIMCIRGGRTSEFCTE